VGASRRRRRWWRRRGRHGWRRRRWWRGRWWRNASDKGQHQRQHSRQSAL